MARSRSRSRSVAVRNRARDDLPEGVPIVTPEEALTEDVVVELAVASRVRGRGHAPRSTVGRRT